MMKTLGQRVVLLLAPPRGQSDSICNESGRYKNQRRGINIARSESGRYKNQRRGINYGWDVRMGGPRD
jgi:hypothetical protein